MDEWLNTSPRMRGAHALVGETVNHLPRLGIRDLLDDTVGYEAGLVELCFAASAPHLRLECLYHIRPLSGSRHARVPSGPTWVAIGIVPVGAGRVHWSGWWCLGAFVGCQSAFEVRVFHAGACDFSL